MDSKLLLAGLDLDSQGLKQLLDSQQLVDCTLACDGGKISAHKIVLSACSTYLAKILDEHPVEHPIIILPELKIEDVKTLVHYMYTGELLKSNTLDSSHLLRTAAILSVNSLNDFLSGSSGATRSSSGTTNDEAPINFKTISFNSSLDSNDTTTTVSDMSTTLNSSNNNNNNNINNNNSITSSHQQPSNTFTLNGNHNISIANRSDFQFKCPVCENDFQTICSFEYHMQRIHNVTSFGCEICHKPFASLRYVLTDHMRRCHGWRADQKLPCQ